MKKFSHYKPSKSNIKELKRLRTYPASYWEKMGEKMALDLFKFTYKNVPAYKKFVKEAEKTVGTISAHNVKTIEDFKRLPLVTKEHYLRASVYEELFPHKNITDATTISATSGSTGEPFFFPRDESHDFKYQQHAELFLRNQFDLGKKKTLAIVGFALGIWIGGIFTYKNFNKIAQKGHDLTLIPVGSNKDLYLKSFKKFAPFYDQIILTGYPPFLKDLLDAGIEQGINWKDYNLRILTAAEGYSENFRNYIAEKAGIKNVVNDIINMYGTVEQGTLAHETAYGNLIRKIASENETVFKKLFPNASNIPTLAQYYPQDIYFEEVGGEIVATSYGSSIPLVRYKFADLGGVIRFDDMKQKLLDCGIDIMKEAKKWGIEGKVLGLPFVWVYARSDFSLTFRGANIYPGEVSTALDSEELVEFVSGKFTMERNEDKELNQRLDINVELKKDIQISDNLNQKILKKVLEELIKSNSEFKNEYISYGDKALPTIILFSYQDPTYFSVGGKHSWVKK